MMAERALGALLLVFAALTAGEDAGQKPVVTLRQGILKGYSFHRSNHTIYAFEGIPYARPPVGNRRFQDPEEHEGWSGIRNATAFGSNCMQQESMNNRIIGEEDCLFLNVYTSQPPENWGKQKLPVLVWIHGGAFQSGSGDMDKMYPDLYLEKSIVFVSINYRLGVMGFLSSEDSAAPGNAGLKDSVMALRWVQENIGAFGGDSQQVTIQGESAGSSAVHYLTISPLAVGLFHRAICQSGTAVTSNMIMEEPRATAERLRAKVKCDDTLGLVPCLQNADAHELVAHSMGYVDPNKVVLDFCRDAFRPSVEVAGSSEKPFLPAAPQILMNEGVPPVPLLIGTTDAEGIIFLKLGGEFLEKPSRWEILDNGFMEALLPDLPYGLTTEENVLSMRNYYLGNHKLAEATYDNDTLYGFLRMTTDVYFGVGSVRAAEAAARRGAPVYLYEFTYDSPAMAFQKNFAFNASHVAGVAHADDLSFVFSTSIDPEPEDATVRERTVSMMANFIKSGDPSPEGSSLPKWPRYSPENESYLEMGKEFLVRNSPIEGRIAFWRELEDSRRLKRDVDAEHLIVRVEHGLLRGRRAPSVTGGSYISFQGIPYAKPPLGPLRFKDAEAPEPWEGVRDAVEHGSTCFAADLNPFHIYGGEDCLFVNVYTPTLKPLKKMNVMVWIHGGGFISGSGNNDTFGPDYLLAERVVVVTLNYRLGPFGFLYLNEAAPGNAGLKDQVAALRWVQKNIHAFGGNPAKVTIFGESAGAASVHLQMLSPLSAGLFHRAIAQSSSAISPWAIQTSPAETARRLASTVGCSTNNDQEAVDCLRTANATELMIQAFTNAPTPVDQDRIVDFVFVPSEEFPKHGVEMFLPAPAIDLIAEGRQHQVPFLIGFTNNESILVLTFDNFLEEEEARKLDASWSSWLLPELHLPLDESNSPEALQTLRDFYMNGQPLTNETIPQFMNMMTDITFASGIYYTLRKMLLHHREPIYEYSFTADDKLNFLKANIPFNVSGAAHADDIGYLFRVQGLPEVAHNSSAAKIRARMVRAWTNFAKYGDPTPHDDPLLGVRWRQQTPEHRHYMDIGEEMKPYSNLNTDRSNFFEEFYRTYG